MCFFIYGAGIVASSLYAAILKLKGLKPEVFLVSELAGNPAYIDGIPVVQLSKLGKLPQTARVLVAAPEIHHVEIGEKLVEAGFAKVQIIFADNKLENELLESYYRSLPEAVTVMELLENVRDDGRSVQQDIVVLQAKCHSDRPLSKPFCVPNYICPIQVGAALTDQEIACIRDDSGDNISRKNRNYCELTASYYAWKNIKSAYKGLCHYRRVFDISQEQMQSLIGRDWDVILPYPTVHYPDISAQHLRYINDADWNALLEALSQIAPEYLKAYEDAIARGEKYFFNFNMLIARADVFDDYCSFVFSVLARAEELVLPRGSERADRFAGYMGENLTTIYFIKNRARLKIIYAGKFFLC